MDTQDTSEYIKARFTLGRTIVNDKGDYIIWNGTNDALIWWILCLVNEEFLNVDINTYKKEDVPQVVAFAYYHFLSYDCKEGVHYHSKGSLERTYSKIKGLYDWLDDDLQKHNPGLHLIKTTVIDIASP